MEQYGDLRGVFTNYSSEYYKKIIMDAYEEAGVDPINVAYIEADGCAIKVYCHRSGDNTKIYFGYIYIYSPSTLKKQS